MGHNTHTLLYQPLQFAVVAPEDGWITPETYRVYVKKYQNKNSIIKLDLKHQDFLSNVTATAMYLHN
jgi:hypothetical protein